MEATWEEIHPIEAAEMLRVEEIEYQLRLAEALRESYWYDRHR